MPTIRASTRQGLPLLHWTAFDGLPLDAAVTTRDGGVSTGPYTSLNLGLHVGDREADVVENRSRVARSLGTDLEDLVFCEQTHQPNVVVVTAEHAGRGARGRADALQDTDAMVTASHRVALVVMVADCVPVVLYDPVRHLLGVAHAGWGGTVRGVTPAAVTALQRLGAEPADLLVGIGPSIAPDRYQVGRDVVTAAETAFGDAVGEVVRPDGTGRWRFDLWRANTLQLERCGVPLDAVHVAGLDTGPGTPFFSHRAGAPTGRFAVVARLRPLP